MIPIRNLYYLLCYAWGHLEESDLVDSTELERLDNVQNLFGKVLAEGVFRLTRRGLGQGYIKVTEELAGIRGKLQVAAMATTAVRARGRTICTYEVFSPDVLHNQILRSTLGMLLRTHSLDPAIREDVALAHERLDGVRTIRVTSRLFRRVQLNRNQRHYRFLLHICRLVHESLLIDEQTGDSHFRDFRRNDQRMWQLFEDFVREFFRVEQNTFRVLDERKVPWGGLTGKTPADETYVPEMAADVLLESSSRRIVLDTKFYSKPLSHRWGSSKLRSTNLYQLLAYLQNRQISSPLGPRHEGILLYAAVGLTFAVDVNLAGFRMQARTVDLSLPFQEIRGEMLKVLGRGEVQRSIDPEAK